MPSESRGPEVTCACERGLAGDVDVEIAEGDDGALAGEAHVGDALGVVDDAPMEPMVSTRPETTRRSSTIRDPVQNVSPRVACPTVGAKCRGGLHGIAI